MGNVISLDQHRRTRRARGCPGVPGEVVFSFDLRSPWTYLAAERVDRRFAAVRWRPVLADALVRADEAPAERRRAEATALSLRLPLVWPEPACGDGELLGVMRVAAAASERGRGAAFVLAASRLAFCGGFDLDDPEIVAEAAAAAGLAFAECRRAAADPSRDAAMRDAGRRLVAGGADRLPVLQIGRLTFCGEDRLPAAAAAARLHGETAAAPAPGA